MNGRADSAGDMDAFEHVKGPSEGPKPQGERLPQAASGCPSVNPSDLGRLTGDVAAAAGQVHQALSALWKAVLKRIPLVTATFSVAILLLSLSGALNWHALLDLKSDFQAKEHQFRELWSTQLAQGQQIDKLWVAQSAQEKQLVDVWGTTGTPISMTVTDFGQQKGKVCSSAKDVDGIDVRLCFLPDNREGAQHISFYLVLSESFFWSVKESKVLYTISLVNQMDEARTIQKGPFVESFAGKKDTAIKTFFLGEDPKAGNSGWVVGNTLKVRASVKRVA